MGSSVLNKTILIAILLTCISNARSLDSALRADPYFAQKLKMQLQKDKYAEAKAKYEQQKLARLQKKNSANSQDLKKLKRTPKKNSSPTIDYNNYRKWVKPAKHSQFKHRVKQLGFKVKYDVRFDGMDPKWYDLLPKVRNAFGTFVPWITSGTDGRHHKHGKYSHYTGHKIDIRVKNMPGVRIRGKRVVRGKAKIKQFVNKLNAIQGIKAVFEERTTFPHIDILVEY